MPISDIGCHPYQSYSGDRNSNNSSYGNNSISGQEKQDKNWIQVIQEAVTSKPSEEKKSNKAVENVQTSNSKVMNLLNKKGSTPYSYLAKDGLITYNKVTFICDTEHNAICLGDTSNLKKCLTIPLSGGGSLIVNRDSLGALAKAIGMFSPQDMKRIMDAIALDNKIRKVQTDIEDTKNSLGEEEQT